MRIAMSLVAASCLLGATCPAAALPPDPYQPAASGGVELIAAELRALATNTRVLVIGAHPDDEDTTLLAWVARGLGGEAAYFSLTRGEGGQNRFGTELGEGLGLLRSRELEAARRLDGARQFFSRAIDFGFSKTREEALAFWPEHELLKDAVRVVRRFRPQVIVAVFPPDSRAGHGQHQASGLVAERVFELASDPGAYPDLADEGLLPWQPARFFRRTWFDPDSATHSVDLGRLESFSGRSFAQIAMASRSLHRSQDMGQLQELGTQPLRLAQIAGDPAPAGGDPFQELDRRPAALVARLPEGTVREEIGARLETVEALAGEALEGLRPADPSASLPFLTEIVRHLEAAVALLRPLGAADLEAAWLLGELEARYAKASRGAAAAAGLVWDVFTDRESLVAGETLEVTVRVWNAGKTPIELPELAAVVWSPRGWSEIQGVGFAADPRPTTLAPGERVERTVQVRIHPRAEPSAPAFLARPAEGLLYDWSEVPTAQRGLPFGPPGLEARLSARIGAAPLRLSREIVARRKDQELGEVRRPLRVLPALEVAVAPATLVRRAGDRSPVELDVVLTNRSAETRRGVIEAFASSSGAEVPFELVPGESRSIDLSLAAPEAPGEMPVRVRARAADGAVFERSFPLVDHSHIAPIPWPHTATSTVSTLEVAFADQRIGWIRGPGDDLPERLAALGAKGRVLDSAALAGGDFANLDVIVIGARAWETEPALSAANPALLEWVAAGGRLWTLYQRYPFFESPRAPQALVLERPMPRTVDETAPMRALDPTSPLWTTPNELGPEDQQGWVQERGLFYPTTWGVSFRPFLAMADPGEEEQLGAILAMRHGAGVWGYTGLAFFRQLPAGVPGAWRLFANLLALGPEALAVGADPSDPPVREAEGIR